GGRPARHSAPSRTQTHTDGQRGHLPVEREATWTSPSGIGCGPRRVRLPGTTTSTARTLPRPTGRARIGGSTVAAALRTARGAAAPRAAGGRGGVASVRTAVTPPATRVDTVVELPQEPVLRQPEVWSERFQTMLDEAKRDEPSPVAERP